MKQTNTPSQWSQSNEGDGEVRRRPRRSQEARRSATIAKLMDAAIELLVETGFAKASTNEICQRAGVSQGALFRHFATRAEFMNAVADEVLLRQIETFEAWFYDDLQRQERSLDALIERGVRFTHQVCHSRLGLAWMELITASRTDDKLREKMRHCAQEARDKTRQAALRIFEGRVNDHSRFQALVDTVILSFEMERAYAHLDQDKDASERRLNYAIDSYRRFFQEQ